MKLQKETRKHGRWYDDACGTAFALELIGERWALLIVRELMFGPRRFTDLRADLPAISAKILTERLDGLERAGVIQRRQLPPPAAAQVYELTEWGYRADAAIMELGRWAACSPDHDPTLPLSAASLMLSFRTMFGPARAQELVLSAAIGIGPDRFQVAVSSGSLTIERGQPDAPDLVMTAPTAPVIAAAVYAKADLAELAGLGLTATGDETAVQRFINLFHLPAERLRRDS